MGGGTRMKKKTIGLLALAVVVAASIGIVRYRKRGPEGVKVETAPVERTTIVQTVTATGRIQPKTQVNISADVGAKITRLTVEEGDWVEQGQLLVELDRERYLAAVEVAEAALNAAVSNTEVARENMVKAEKDYSRVEQLHAGDLESQAALDANYAAAQACKAEYRASLDRAEQARAALKQAKDDLSKTSIYSPLSGTVSKLNKEQGEIALGSQFQEDVIMVVSNLAGMEALVDVDENDIVLVGLDNNASIEVDALPDVDLRGTVTEIANSAKLTESGTANQKTEFEVKVAVTEPDPKLRPGMTASAEIVTQTKDEVLGIPIQCVAVRTPQQLKTGMVQDSGVDTAVEFRPDRDGFVELVFVVEDGRAAARQVVTGIQSESRIEILDGLDEGEQVVVGNYRAISKDLQHGSMVAVTNRGGPSREAVLASN
jgi:HlyD family secretion protein